jgi:outer membrane protein OmpA-like peptidoglycan-associated protein
MKKILSLTAAGALLLSSCGTVVQNSSVNTAPQKEQSGPNKAVIGAAVGAVIGGAVGATTGPKHGNKSKRILIGSVAGAILGGAIGYVLEEQAKALGNDLGVKPIDHTNPAVKSPQPPINEKRPVAVVKEPSKVRVVLKSSLLFDVNSYRLKPEAQKTLEKIAQTLRQNPDTVVVVAGYTDNTGSLKYNLKLSKKRAEAVKEALVKGGVNPERIIVVGCGPKKPIASNDTAEGRALNRRVEILVYPKGTAIPNACQ